MNTKLNLRRVQDFFKEFGYYFVNFFMSVIIGFGFTLLLDLPMKFIRAIPIDLGHFIVHFLGMCIALYIRSYQRGYHQNTRTYSFRFKKALLLVATIFAAQILIVSILGIKNGGHAVYIAGPSRWLAEYILYLRHPDPSEQYAMYCLLNWLFMLLLDIFVYAPIMLLGEYLGAKRNSKEIASTKQE